MSEHLGIRALYGHAVTPPDRAIDVLRSHKHIGCLRDVSRQQAMDERKSVYVSRRLTPFDKVFFLEDGSTPVVVRYINGLTPGQLKIQKEKLQ